MKRIVQVGISKEDYECLVSLGKNYYSCPGDKPESPEEVLHDLIEEKWFEAHPREYQTTGFDRQ